MRLSVAMIVRDEADFLPHCLATTGPLADEWCVVDTGSTDSTPDIARAHGCRVASFAWAEDFAAARNAAIDCCTGDWVLVLDADEVIAPADHAALRALLDGPPAGYRMTTLNYTNDSGVHGFVPVAPGDPHAAGFAGWTPSTKVRLFPNVPAARFRGRVHELVNDALLEAQVPLRDCAVPVHHYGARRPEAALAAKRAHYLALGQAKLREAPGDPRAHAELGNQYAELGRYAEAARAYREALALQPANAAVLKDLGAMLHLLGAHEPARQALELAVRTEPENADAWRNLAVVHAEREDWAAARDCLDEALARTPDESALHRYRALMLLRLGHGEDAWQAAARAVALAPALPECWDTARHVADATGHETELETLRTQWPAGPHA